MANTNTTTNVVDTMFAQGLMALREMAIMPRYVNRAYDPRPGEKGSTVEVPIPSAITAAAVTPSYVPPDDAGVSPTKKVITLNQWYETAFFLNDKEVGEIRAGFVNSQLSEAIRGLANNVDAAILALYTQIYNYGGTAGATPFAANFDAFTEARAALARTNAPKNPRYCVINEDAEANVLGLRPLQDLSYRGDQNTLREGEIGRVLGANWAMDQNIPNHTAGADLVGAVNETGGVAVGTKSIAVDGLSAAFNEGDIFTIAGDSQTYVATAGCTTTLLNFEPGLKVAFPTADGNQVITNKGSHAVNLLFHPDAFALAARPIEASDPLGIAVGNRRSIMDPVSGLSLTLEVTRQHYRTRFAFSTLYGVQCIRPELAARIAG